MVETGRESDHLTGDWGGLRSRLLNRGLHVQAGYVAESMTVVQGGRQGGTSADAVLDVGLEFDLERLTGGLWTGARFRASSLWLHGSSPKARVGDDLGLSNIDGLDTVRLYDLWLEQSLAQDRLLLRAGQQVVDGEFATSRYAGVFVHGNFGWPSFVAANTRNNGPAYPVGVLGLFSRARISDHVSAQIGVFDGDSYDDPAGDPSINAHGTHFRLTPAQGSLSLAETTWEWSQDPAAAGHPGRIKLGGWWHSGSFPTLRNPGRTTDLRGGYALVEQLLWRESSQPETSPQGLGCFLRFGLNSDDGARYGWVLDGALNYHGLIPGRDDDTLGLAFIHAHAGSDWRVARSQAGNLPLPDHESVIEAAYRFQFTPWWSLQPGLQYVLHPGGSSAIPNALVLGLRTNLTF